MNAVWRRQHEGALLEPNELIIKKSSTLHSFALATSGRHGKAHRIHIIRPAIGNQYRRITSRYDTQPAGEHIMSGKLVDVLRTLLDREGCHHLEQFRQSGGLRTPAAPLCVSYVLSDLFKTSHDSPAFS